MVLYARTDGPIKITRPAAKYIHCSGGNLLAVERGFYLHVIIIYIII